MIRSHDDLRDLTMDELKEFKKACGQVGRCAVNVCKN